MNKPIMFFDLETTGTDVATDRIVQMAVHFPDKDFNDFNLCFNPGIPIPAQATAVHGITNEYAANEPLFKDYAKTIWYLTESHDLAGYNILRFDVPLLAEELLRADKDFVLRPDINIIDAYQIFIQKEQRTLAAALQFYCNRDHDGAHDAMIDVIATRDVLEAQLARYDFDCTVDNHAEYLHTFCTRGRILVDWAGKFAVNDTGDIVFTFGKHQGKKASSERGYLQWMLYGNFAETTKVVCKELLKK